MRPLPVVELEIAGQLFARLGDALIRMQIDVLVLDAAPEPLDEDVVEPAAFSVHADLDTVVGQRPGEVGASELAALVGIEYLRRAVPGNRLLQCLDAEVRGTPDAPEPCASPSPESPPDRRSPGALECR